MIGANDIQQSALVDLPEVPPELGLPPLFRFAGGKRWLVPFVRVGIRLHLAGASGARYIEPFCGGIAVGLHIGWPATTANDVSPDLTDCYLAVARDPLGVWTELARLISATPLNDLDQLVMVRGRAVAGPVYYAVRATYNAALPARAAGVGDPVRAAQFLYLTARSYNGVLRVNRAGKFNTPVGSARDPHYPELADLHTFARATATWTWTCADFEPTIDQARRGDVIFADPPYADTFAGYARGGFGTRDQVRLAAALARARDRGAHVLHTNANTPEIRDLYDRRGFWRLPTAEMRAVNCDSKGRKRAGCLIVTSVPDLLAVPDEDE